MKASEASRLCSCTNCLIKKGLLLFSTVLLGITVSLKMYFMVLVPFDSFANGSRTPSTVSKKSSTAAPQPGRLIIRKASYQRHLRPRGAFYEPRIIHSDVSGSASPRFDWAASDSLGGGSRCQAGDGGASRCHQEADEEGDGPSCRCVGCAL